LNGLVLSLFDLTGNMVKPWADAGYETLCIDIQRDGTDILRWLPPRRDYRMVFAFPPCTNLAVSGARWFKDKGLAGLGSAIELVERARDICEWSGAPWMLENPVGTLASYWRKSDHIFHPHEFAGLEPADNYTKKTCLWTGGGFIMPHPFPLQGQYRAGRPHPQSATGTGARQLPQRNADGVCPRRVQRQSQGRLNGGRIGERLCLVVHGKILRLA
jgi:hypothetical protein